MFTLGIPWWEFIVRAAAVYIFLLVLLRLTGKRQVGQLAPFDLVLLLVLSNAVQNSMNGGDNSLVGGLDLRGDADRAQPLDRLRDLPEQAARGAHRGPAAGADPQRPPLRGRDGEAPAHPP